MKPSTIILLRHGESQWNHENRFTGWADVPLTLTGQREAVRAGVLLREAGSSAGCGIQLGADSLRAHDMAGSRSAGPRLDTG